MHQDNVVSLWLIVMGGGFLLLGMVVAVRRGLDARDVVLLLMAVVYFGGCSWSCASDGAGDAACGRVEGSIDDPTHRYRIDRHHWGPARGVDGPSRRLPSPGSMSAAIRGAATTDWIISGASPASLVPTAQAPFRP